MLCARNAIAFLLVLLSNILVCSSLVTVSFTELVSGDDGLYVQREEGYGESGSGKLDGEVMDDKDTESKPPPTLIVVCCLCFLGFLVVVVSLGILTGCCCKRRCWICRFTQPDGTSNSPEPPSSQPKS